MTPSTVLRSLTRKGMRYASIPVWRRLARDGGARGRALATAITAAIASRSDPEEIAWIGRIEGLRSRLLSRKDVPVWTPPGSPGVAAVGASRTSARDKENALTVGQVCLIGSKSAFWGLVLFRIIRELKPVSCLELGTCLGMSAAYQAAALRLNGRGELVTLEGNRARVALARENLAALGLDNVRVVPGLFQETLGGIARSYDPLDYVFIDGHHEEHATIRYFEQVCPHLSPEAAVVLDDISWSHGMHRAWTRIRSAPGVAIAIDLKKIGVCVVDSHIRRRVRVRVPVY